MGQAAWFDSYTLEDGTVVRCGNPADVAEASPEALAAAEAAVEEQAAAVRTLKQQDGMTNKSPEVQARPPAAPLLPPPGVSTCAIWQPLDGHSRKRSGIRIRAKFHKAGA